MISAKEVYWRQPRATAEERWQAILWRRRGVSVPEIARRLGFSDKAVRDWLRGLDE